jgi:REP element-mobilizing transposase RayT
MLPKANVFARHFVYLQQYYIVICMEYYTAVVLKHNAAHLARNYNQTIKQDRTDV